MTRFLAILAALCISTTAFAQTYPDRISDGVNDFASIIDEDTEARITAKLEALSEEHNTEVSIATLSSVRFYAQDLGIEGYATGLFNEWAIGDAEANTGILILVFRDDRELRIETGSGYDALAQTQVERVIAQDIVPHFQDQDYSAGIEAGIDGLLTRVIAPTEVTTSTSATPAGTESEGGNTIYYVLGAIGAAIAGLIGLNRRNAAKFAKQPCASCGKTGLVKSREVLKPATLDAAGEGETKITCPSCGHVEATPYTISKLTPEKPKGGGKSEGGGATGKW